MGAGWNPNSGNPVRTSGYRRSETGTAWKTPGTATGASGTSSIEAIEGPFSVPPSSSPNNPSLSSNTSVFRFAPLKHLRPQDYSLAYYCAVPGPTSSCCLPLASRWAWCSRKHSGRDLAEKQLPGVRCTGNFPGEE